MTASVINGKPPQIDEPFLSWCFVVLVVSVVALNVLIETGHFCKASTVKILCLWWMQSSWPGLALDGNNSVCGNLF